MPLILVLQAPFLTSVEGGWGLRRTDGHDKWDSPKNNMGPWVPLTRVQDPPVRVLLASSLPVGLRRRLCAQLGIPSHGMDGSQDG